MRCDQLGATSRACPSCSCRTFLFPKFIVVTRVDCQSPFFPMCNFSFKHNSSIHFVLHSLLYISISHYADNSVINSQFLFALYWGNYYFWYRKTSIDTIDSTTLYNNLHIPLWICPLFLLSTFCLSCIFLHKLVNKILKVFQFCLRLLDHSQNIFASIFILLRLY